MNCPACSTVMVTARATNFGEDYWYCQSCKKELAELTPPPAAAVKVQEKCACTDLFVCPPCLKVLTKDLDDVFGPGRKFMTLLHEIEHAVSSLYTHGGVLPTKIILSDMQYAWLLHNIKFCHEWLEERIKRKEFIDWRKIPLERTAFGTVLAAP